jgi:hypothetical protein
VIQRGYRTHLFREQLTELLRRDFDGDVASGSRIVGAIDGSHPAGGKKGDDPIRTERLPCFERWCRHQPRPRTI